MPLVDIQHKYETINMLPEGVIDVGGTWPNSK